jgi:hypothetical protein
VKIVFEFPCWLEFNRSDWAQPLIPLGQERYKFMGDMEYHKWFWKEFMRTRHILYLQSPRETVLNQNQALDLEGRDLYLRK